MAEGCELCAELREQVANAEGRYALLLDRYHELALGKQPTAPAPVDPQPVQSLLPGAVRSAIAARAPLGTAAYRQLEREAFRRLQAGEDIGIVAQAVLDGEPVG